MVKKYNELLEYDIDGAIKLIGKSDQRFTTIEEMLQEADNDPANTPNNPLLADFNYVYEHVEEIYCRNIYSYQKHQGFEQYYTFFKALIKKYSVEEDYQKCLCGQLSFSALNIKWGMFVNNLINFINHAFDERLSKLLEQKDILEYLFRYPELFHPTLLAPLSNGKLLKHQNIASYFTNTPHQMFKLIRRYFKVNIPTELLLDQTLIKNTSHTYHIFDFYFELSFLSEQVSEQPYLDEHRVFCDSQVSQIKNGIFPCYQNRCKENRKVSFDELRSQHSPMERKVIERIFNRRVANKLPLSFIYQELSKYMLVGMFISRNYQTDPYNLLIDIETLYHFATTHNRDIKGLLVYETLVYFEDKTLEQLLKFYNRFKNVPLMDILYDDWNSLKYEFIDELNSKTYKLDDRDIRTNSSNVTYYDVSDIVEPLIVHNTGVSISDEQQMKKLVETVKKGNKGIISLSVQDSRHMDFYTDGHNRLKRTIKFIYGPLEKDRVGIIWHADAYSKGADKVEIENVYYKRELYTLDELMKRTQDFNEIVYVINGKVFMPIGIFCENWVEQAEIQISDELQIPIVFRRTKDISSTSYRVKPPEKQYIYTAEKKLF